MALEGSLFEEIPVELVLNEQIPPGRLNRILKELGATLHYDVYGFARSGKHPIWQSEDFASVDLFIAGERADAQDGADKIVLSYPMATIPSSYINQFLDLAFALAERLETPVLLSGKPIDRDALLAEFDEAVGRLMSEWGEEPGSESLAIMIETQYGAS